MIWQEVRRGRYITEIGNHGTAIMAARIAEPTNNLMYVLVLFLCTNEYRYSIDDGDSWIDCQFGSLPIDVRNIRISSDFSSTKFLLYGHKDSKAYLVSVDLTDAYNGKCTESDFEIWVCNNLQYFANEPVPERCSWGVFHGSSYPISTKGRGEEVLLG
jgi:hypothetical protein